MKALWFLLVVVQAAIGGLAMLRCLEQMQQGGGTKAAVQLVIGIVFLFGAWQSLKKARDAR
jgi:hypothetical protein